MSDLALLHNDLNLDLVQANGDLSANLDLENAILISLLSDRALEENSPAIDGYKGGWWGDVFPKVSNDKIGSLLWTLKREKATTETATRAREIVVNALDWMIEDGVASRIEVTTQIVERDCMEINIQIHRPNGINEFKFDFAWQAQELKRKL